MKVQFNHTFHLSDTLIPDIFISEYMGKLSREAIRAYLLIVQNYQHGNRELSIKELTQRLDSSEKKVEKALSELQFLNLIIIQSGYLQIVDIKFLEMQKLVQSRNENTAISQAELSKRELIIQQINDTFFQGMMSLGFYTKIDEWFTKYEFEPEVLYAIFSEAACKNKLDSPGYVSGIADNWAANGVKTYRQLNHYYKEYEATHKLYAKVKEKLNIKANLSVYQEELIAKWKNEYGYDFPIIDLALQATVNINSPNLKYVDRILTNWYHLNLHTKEEIERYLKDYQTHKKAQKAQIKQKKSLRSLKSETLKEQDLPEEELYNVKLLQYLAQQEGHAE